MGRFPLCCALDTCSIVCLALVGASIAHADTHSSNSWPQFRGPDGQGHATARDLPLNWSETENVVWKTPIPGNGWSSPVIHENQIWLTTAHTAPADEAQSEKRLQGTTNSQPLVVVNNLRMHAVCIDKTSGQLLHNIQLLSEAEPDPIHVLNSFASPTPVIEAGQLYCHFGTNGTASVDTCTGKVLWTNQRLRIKHENGAGGSPIVWRDRLIFHCDGSDVQYIVALDKNSGEVAWRAPRSGALRENPQLRKAYGTPLIVTRGGRDVLVSPAADWVYGYDPQTGEELWRLSYGALGFSIVPRPIAGPELVYFCTCFMRSELLALRLDASQPNNVPTVVWRYGKQVPLTSSPLLVDGLLFFVSDNGGVLTCLDAETGEMLWRERLGGNFSASPLYADGRVYFFDREGATHVIRPGRKFELLARNELEGSFMASAAAVQQALFLRTDQALYRIEK